ncbi:uncharacterized protein B0I36DRAFT_55467 [Microdochium trichocladiopsis]|uniref:Uncharacterized protein n=1 Tax=Microdochium trichocladiopsis TaxID=1682393 RepID=A0A9P9BF95_9PEZI|nr:uncharacterized protein B0I36DRAFT_55467 [Microdochium trichocladiopsis]KAH7010756.1 hypothetical protein B0I36DRAFT_55467 [Microdochium trichocladiopsis]
MFESRIYSQPYHWENSDGWVSKLASRDPNIVILVQVDDASTPQFIELNRHLVRHTTVKEFLRGSEDRELEEACQVSFVTTSEPEQSSDNSGAVFMLSRPKNGKTKRQQYRVPEDHFVFGRQGRATDFSISARKNVSHALFWIGYDENSRPIVQSRGSSQYDIHVNDILLQQDADTDTACLWLNPHLANEIEVVGLAKLRVYCRNVRLLDDPIVPQIADSSEIESSVYSLATTAVLASSMTAPGFTREGPSLVFYPHRIANEEYLALDMCTGYEYIARYTPVSNIKLLRQNVCDFQDLRVDGSFLIPTAVHHVSGVNCLLVPFRPGILSLQAISNDDHYSLAERRVLGVRLFRELLRVIGRLHRQGFSHGRLSMRTVLAVPSPCDIVPIYIDCSSLTLGDPTLFSNDCLSIFSLVRDFIGEPLDELWTQDSSLTEIWKNYLSKSPGTSWKRTVIEIGRQLNLSDQKSSDGWDCLTVYKDVLVSPSGNRVSTTDIEFFLLMQVSVQQIKDGKGQHIINAVRKYDEDGTIAITELETVIDHLRRKHSVSFYFGELSRFLENPGRTLLRTAQNIPYHPSCGLLQLEPILHLAPDNERQGLESFCSDLYELRGHQPGVFVTLLQFQQIAKHLDLQYEPRDLVEPSNSMARYSSPDWYLVSHHQFCGVQAVGALDNVVAGSTQPHTGEILPRITINRAALFSSYHSQSRAGMGTCSVASSEDPFTFKFSTARRPLAKTQAGEIARRIDGQTLSTTPQQDLLPDQERLQRWFADSGSRRRNSGITRTKRPWEG